MVSKKDVGYYKQSLKLAKTSTCRDKHGAIVVKNGSVLSFATNRNCSNPISKSFKKQTIHAEQRAIACSRSNLVGATLYSARYHRNGISTPCVMCMELIRLAGIRSIVYYDGIKLRKVMIF